jgi:uncharacterized protein (DUF58 family)
MSGVTRIFPAGRIFWYSVPAIFAFLFFPFRALQWVSILVILFLLIAYAFSYVLYRGMSAQPVIPVVYGYPDDEYEVELTIINDSPLPALNLGLSVITPSERPGHQKRQGLLALSAESRDRFAAKFSMTRRGEFALPLSNLEGSDPFSLFPWRISYRNLCRVIVYPEIHHGVLIPKRGVSGGAIRVSDPRYEDVNRIGSIRDYVPGDDIRRIHWNATAKSGDLRTSELLTAMDAPTVVLFDMDSAVFEPKYRYERIEHAVEIAASIVHALGDLRQRVGFISNGIASGGNPVIPPTGRTDSAALALRVLARITSSEDVIDPVSIFLDSGFSVQAGMGCYIVSPRSPEEFATRLVHPTMTALRPTYFHLAERRALIPRGIPLDYLLITSPKELFRRGA